MPLTQQQANDLIIEAKSRNQNLTRDEATAILKNADNQLLNQEGQTDTFQQGINKIGAMTPEQRSGLTVGQQFATAPYRNVGQEQRLSFGEKAVLKTGETLHKVAPTALGILGDILGTMQTKTRAGGRLLGSQGTMAGELLGGIAEESGQSYAGVQDQRPGEQINQVAMDTLKEGVIDYAFSSVFDAITGIPQAKQTIVERLFKSPITDNEINKVIAENAKSSFEKLSKRFPTEELATKFREFGLDQVDTLVKKETKHGQYRTNGTLRLFEQIGDIYKKELEPVLKQSSEKVKKSELLNALESRRNPENEKYVDFAIKTIKESKQKTWDMVDLYKMKTDAMSGAFNKAGQGYKNIDAGSGREIGFSVMELINKKVDGIDDVVKKMADRYAYMDIIENAGKKFEKDILKRSGSKAEAIKVMAALGTTAGATLINPTYGLISALGSAPTVYGAVKSATKGSELRKIGREATEKAVEKGAPIVRTALERGSKTLLDLFVRK